MAWNLKHHCCKERGDEFSSCKEWGYDVSGYYVSVSEEAWLFRLAAIAGSGAAKRSVLCSGLLRCSASCNDGNGWVENISARAESSSRGFKTFSARAESCFMAFKRVSAVAGGCFMAFMVVSAVAEGGFKPFKLVSARAGGCSDGFGVAGCERFQCKKVGLKPGVEG
jgi:hypothetical protein